MTRFVSFMRRASSPMMLGLHIERAQVEDEEACFALLPEVFGGASEFLIARRKGIVVGAASVRWESWREPGGFPLWLRVIPGEERQGIGRALVGAAQDLIEDETDGLWSRMAVRDETDAASFLQACGFVPAQRQLHFEIGTRQFLDFIEVLAQRSRDRSRIPENARTMPLREADQAQVALIVSAGFRSSPGSLLSSLMRPEGSVGALDQDHSSVAIEGDRIVGALLVKWVEGVPVIQANVVTPDRRGSWANIALLEGSTRAGWLSGAERFRFYCEEANRDTMNLAKRASATMIAAEAFYYQAASARSR